MLLAEENIPGASFSQLPAPNVPSSEDEVAHATSGHVKSGLEDPSPSEDSEDDESEEVEVVSPSIKKEKAPASIIQTRSQAKSKTDPPTSVLDSKTIPSPSKSTAPKATAKRGGRTPGSSSTKSISKIPSRAHVKPLVESDDDAPAPSKGTRTPAATPQNKTKGKAKAEVPKQEGSSSTTSLSALQSAVPSLPAARIQRLDDHLSKLPSVSLHPFILSRHY
jgi:hypothetical protein